MAILTGINSELTGSIGKVTYSRQGGQTVARQKVTRKSNPKRTPGIMVNRMQWANLVHIWQAFSGKLKPSFQGKEPGKSDFNEFMASNLGKNKVYLTKSDSKQGGAVVAPYQVTRGTLPSVSTTIADNQKAITDIAMGSITIGASTTLATFSTAILENNPDWQAGDQLTVFNAKQSVDPTTNTPRVVIDAFEITLDPNDDGTLLADLVGASLLETTEGKLGTSSTINGAIAVIHSRKVSGATAVSTQFFVGNNAILPTYQTESARSSAILSYGGVNDEQYLTPNATADLSAQP